MIDRHQLLTVGLGPSAIDHRVARNALRVMHRGVYMVGPVVPALGEEMAAILACPRAAWISHESAAFLHRLPPYPAKPRPVTVTVTGSAIRRRGLRVRRVESLHPDEITEIERVPVVTTKRAILDIAGSAPALLERVVSEAIASGRTTRSAILDLCERRPSARGVGRLRSLLDDTALVTRSGPERTLRRLLRHADLPMPESNARIGRWEVDFLWPDTRLIVEVDALSTHTSPFHFERDRRKDAELTLRGYTVIRVTLRQLTDEPDAVITRIRAAIDLLTSPRMRK